MYMPFILSLGERQRGCKEKNPASAGFFAAALKNNLFDSILGALHWGVAAFCAKQKGDGQHICSTEHGHHSKEPSQLFQAFFCWQDL
ncbi:hypothetical protein FOB20_07635 [Acinetobacter lwoffii]|jgi:hypothetical protein|nr:hypothetical protein FOB21_10650 [Acinetobacter lwoffii]QKT98686.1 hypothetical protein FOB20_07635 [Acinetobacter lwoffii]